MLDLASGSGLVAIAAAIAGAGGVFANDIDPMCEAAVAANADLNGVATSYLAGDLIDGPLPNVDVVLAADVFYEQTPAKRFLAFLHRAHAAGMAVYAGDPGRTYFPRNAFRQVAEYEVATSTEIENAPIKTARGWLHVAQGTRTTAAGLRSVLYAFLCDLEEPARVIAAPAGYLLAADDGEQVGDVPSGLACAGAVARATGEVLLYYASAETRAHVATTSVERLLDYVTHTAGDSGSSHASVAERTALVERNLKLLARTKGKAYRGVRS